MSNKRTIEDLKSLGDTVFFREWEPQFEAHGDGFLFSWVYPKNGEARTTRRHYITHFDSDLTIIDTMQTAVLNEITIQAIEDFSVSPNEETPSV
jgi:hypothetical protein